MAPRSQLKRKASVAEAEADKAAFSDDEFGDGVLEGVLSDSEDDEDNSEDGDAAGADGGEAELDSDEIPSDEDEDGQKPNYRVERDANGGERYVYEEIEPDYDSDDSDAKEPANTIGNIDLSFYDSYPHIGYSIDGKKIMRPATGDALDALLDTIEVPKGWTGLTDPATGKPLNLSQDELELLRRVQMNEMPEEGYDPYPEYVDWATYQKEIMPLSAAPEPKRRFLPSKHEQKKVMKLVRAIREGRILPYKPPQEREEEEEEPQYDLWADEQPQEPNVMHIPAPKLPPPGYDLSYNPPPEYLPTKEERKQWEETDPEEREKEYLPQRYDALRKTPAYDGLVKERFERCLDLYLAPRVRKNRLNIDPSSLLPKLPRAEELKPFPTVTSVLYDHGSRVRSVAIDPSGKWVASGGDDGFVKFWELETGKLMDSIKLSSDEPISVARWRPGKETMILSATAGSDIFFIVPSMIHQELYQASRDVLDAGFGYAAKGKQAEKTSDGARKESPGTWSRPGARLEDQGVLLKVTVRADVKVLSWHKRGDYFVTVSPTGQRSSVAVSTLSKHLTQHPFHKIPGLAQTAQFHPTRPLLFVALQRTVRVYDLVKQELVKAVQPGARWISSIDIHPGGDNLIVSSYDRRLLWHDMELSARPFKTMRFHSQAIRAAKFHRSFPLFADASDDGTVQIFHGKVFNDLMENPMIVPVKTCRGHKVVNKLGVMDIDWHPTNPWCISSGADGTCRLWT